MSKKYAICTDVHFCQYSSILRRHGKKYSVRLENLIKSMSWFEHLSQEENCDGVFYLGDTFDRTDLNSMEITALQDVYFSDKPHVFITGNHEASIATLEFSSAQVFKGLEAEVISDVRRVEINDKVDLYFIPYFTNDIIKPLSSYIVDKNKKNIILSHNDIAGIQYGKFRSSSGFELEDILDNCTLFINGHLHNGYIINDKVVLVGNLTGLNFNEDANKYEHYAYLLTIEDDGSIKLEARVNPEAFNFYKVKIETDRDIDQLNHLKSNAVLSISCAGNLIHKVEQKLKESKNVVEYKIFATYNNYFGTEDSVDFTVEDHVQQFINYIQTRIEPSVVLDEEISILGSN